MPTVDVNTVICNGEENMPITISHEVSKENQLQKQIDEGRSNNDNI